MRPIKFRVWDKKLNKMWPGITLKKLLCYLIFQQQPNSDAYLAIKDHFEDIEWEQFTGLHDKNGKEIYEGDIATHRKAGDFEGKDLVTGKVVIESSRGVVIGNWPIAFDVEVIGNIHESPELMEGKQ